MIVRKVTIEFELPEDREALSAVMKSGGMESFIWDVEQEVFRPARKHGYADQEIQGLIDALDRLVEQHAGDDHPAGEFGHLGPTDLIRLLEEKYYALKRERFD
ncbi:hypothetical protein EBX31_01850 [bacterium]|nr:hypothetical protein [bacterium]